MNFLRRLVNSYSKGKLSTDPSPPAVEAVALKGDEADLPDVEFHERSSTSSVTMLMESEICDVKIEMMHEAVDDGLLDVPVFVGREARKAAKRERRQESRFEKEKRNEPVHKKQRRVMKNEGQWEIRGGAKRARDAEVNGVAESTPISNKRQRVEKRKRKLVNRREGESRGAVEHMYAVPQHLWGLACHPDRCADPNWRECPPDCPKKDDRYHKDDEQCHYCAE
jgi:hypothetical protein